MPQHDPQRTSLCPVVAPLHPRLRFTIRNQFVHAVSGTGVMYAVGAGASPLKTIDGAGRTIWTANVVPDSMALGPSGTALVTSEAAPLQAMAFSPSGEVLWQIAPFGLTKGAPALATDSGEFVLPIVGPNNGDGIPFLGLNVIAAGGTLLHHVAQPIFAPAVAPDGTIYDGAGGRLTALAPSGSVRWRHALAYNAEPLIGKNADIFVAQNSRLVAFAPFGRRLWSRQEPGGILALAERPGGGFMVAGTTGLTALSASGKRIWTTPLFTRAGARATGVTLAVDARGTAFAGRDDGRVRVVSSRGALLETLFAGGGQSQARAPKVMLGPNGLVVVDGTDGVTRVYGP